LNSLLDGRRMTGEMLSALMVKIGESLFLIFLFFLLRVLLRRQWIALAVFVLLLSGSEASSGHPVIGALYGVLAFLPFAACIVYYGVLPIALAAFVQSILQYFLLTTDLSAWYAGTTVAAVAIVLALTAYAFHTAVAGRALFKAGFLEPK
jgi:hypothetical protein